MNRIVYLVLLVFLAGCATCRKPDEDALVSRIRKDLPSRWQCRVITQEGEKGHPHGLDEPLMRMDLSSPEESFASIEGARTKTLSPLIQLYVYDISDKPHVQKVIQEERLYSWNIPIYFGETEDYIVVTSPAYVNYGVFTEEAKKTIRPMWNVLRKHIPNRGDQTVEQLAHPDK